MNLNWSTRAGLHVPSHGREMVNPCVGEAVILNICVFELWSFSHKSAFASLVRTVVKGLFVSIRMTFKSRTGWRKLIFRTDPSQSEERINLTLRWIQRHLPSLPPVGCGNCVLANVRGKFVWSANLEEGER